MRQLRDHTYIRTNGPHTFLQPCDSMHTNGKDTLSSTGPGTAHTGLDDPLSGEHVQLKIITLCRIYVTVCRIKMIPEGLH